jgi:spore maturation protein CgeB
MINETIILLSPYEDCSKHRLAKHVGYLKVAVPFDVCFYQPLKRVFSRVVLYDYLKRMVEVGVRGVNEEIIELVGKEHPKYVLWLAFGEYYEIQESTFDTIRREGAKVVGWFFDDEVRFDYYSKWWIPHLDYFITNDIEAVPKYGQLGAHAIFTITDTWDSVERDWSEVEEKHEVSFVGSLHADREQYLKILKTKGILVNLSGTAKKRWVSYEEMMDIFATSKVNLNFSKTYAYMKFGIKGRIFKVCLAGGFLLTEYTPGIENFFKIGEEIVCFQSPEEMVDKINYYLNHDDERQAIAQAGWQRANKEYTAFHIMSRVFQEIEEHSAESQSRPKELTMPVSVRKRVSEFYRMWGGAFLVTNHKGLWKDALSLSLSYNPSNLRARLAYAIGSLPLLMRFVPIQFYIAVIKLHNALFACLGLIPPVRKTYRWLRKRLSEKQAKNGM